MRYKIVFVFVVDVVVVVFIIVVVVTDLPPDARSLSTSRRQTRVLETGLCTRS